uniref:CSON007588 protein n=1 Tax=Culicoides sonorensis TaxID=179676 RepID=A0A336MYG8_CULSO
MRFCHSGIIFLIGISYTLADVGEYRRGRIDAYVFSLPGADETNSITSLPVYGAGPQRVRDSRILQVAIIPTKDTPIQAAESHSNIRGRSISNLDGFVEQQKSGFQRNFAGQRIHARKIPDGPITLDDKDHILFPDQFEQLQQLGAAKDSYGNPVTPFPLSNDELKLRAGAYKIDKSGFVIPNYASGITNTYDPHLANPSVKQPTSNVLPPLSSGNFYYPGVKPQISSETVFAGNNDEANELPQPPQLPNIPDVGSTVQSTLIEVPSDGLLPPLETNEFESQYNIPINQDVTVPQKDILPPFQPTQQTQQSGQSDNRYEKPSQVPSQSGVQFTVANNQPVIVPFADKPTQPTFVSGPVAAPTQNTGSKYTGGFGYANGGRPSNVAFNIDNTQNTGPIVTPTQSVFTTTTGNKYTGGFGAPSSSSGQVPSLSNALQAPPLPANNDNKYTGGFVTKPTLPSPTQPQPAPTQSVFTTTTGNKYTGGFGFGNSNAQLQALPVPLSKDQFGQSTNPVLVQVAPQSQGQKYTGGFGGPPGFLVPFDHVHIPSQSGVQFTVANNQPVIVPFADKPTQPTFVSGPVAAPTQNTGNKYTGGFGYANGGRPSNVAFNIDNTQNTGPIVTPTQSVFTTTTGNKYTGGFGAPSSSSGQVPSLSNALQAPPLPANNDNKYTGGFVRKPTLPSPTQPQPAPTQSVFTTTTGNKYTGGFGFGNSNAQLQALPVPLSKDQFGQSTNPVLVQVASQSQGQKYTGGFGGPPGFLVPFDHVHTYSRVQTE